jgi:hypothetical protein
MESCYRMSRYGGYDFAENNEGVRVCSRTPRHISTSVLSGAVPLDYTPHVDPLRYHHIGERKPDRPGGAGM